MDFLPSLPSKDFVWLPFASYLDYKVFSSFFHFSHHSATLFGVWRDSQFVCDHPHTSSFFFFFLLCSLTGRWTSVQKMRWTPLCILSRDSLFYTTTKRILTSKASFSLPARESVVFSLSHTLPLLHVFPINLHVALSLSSSACMVCFVFYFSVIQKVELYCMTCKCREFYCTKMRSLVRPQCLHGVTAGVKALE